MDIISRGLYHPWRAIDRFHRDADAFRRLFDWPVVEARNATEWVPAVDIKEEDDHFVIRADVPGVDPEDLDITMTEGVLSFRGERAAHAEVKEDGFRRTERVSGRFERSFTLPETADPSRIAADYTNGVLQITIPKQEKAESRRIEVKAS